MSIKKIFSYNSGISIIELMIALALLGIVLAMGYSFFFFGANSFRIGEAQSNIQRDIRLTSDFITRETRNAVNVALFTSLPNEAGDYELIYLDGNKIMHKSASGDRSRTEAIIDSLSFNLEEVQVDQNKVRYLLTFSISGSDDSQNYSINSEVFLNNIGKIDIDTETEDDGNLTVLRYKKP